MILINFGTVLLLGGLFLLLAAINNKTQNKTVQNILAILGIGIAVTMFLLFMDLILLIIGQF